MKMVLIAVLLCLLPLLLFASPLGELARKERERRAGLALARQGRKVPSFGDLDLAARGGSRPAAGPISALGGSPSREARDREAERLHWRKERDKLDRELARLDASIRRLESRLQTLRARRRGHDGTDWDAKERDLQEQLLRDSMEALRADRDREIERFLERGRREGALPGWLR